MYDFNKIILVSTLQNFISVFFLSFCLKNWSEVNGTVSYFYLIINILHMKRGHSQKTMQLENYNKVLIARNIWKCAWTFLNAAWIFSEFQSFCCIQSLYAG